MSTAFSTASGLAIVFETRSEKEIDRQLKKLDPDLFLDKDRDRRTGAVFYCVRHWPRERSPYPLHILDWKEADGTPRTLSTGIVYAVEARKQFEGRNIAQEAQAENDARAEQVNAEIEAEVDETAAYFKRRLRLGSGQNSRRYFPVKGQGKA